MGGLAAQGEVPAAAGGRPAPSSGSRAPERAVDSGFLGTASTEVTCRVTVILDGGLRKWWEVLKKSDTPSSPRCFLFF